MCVITSVLSQRYSYSYIFMGNFGLLKMFMSDVRYINIRVCEK